MARLVGVDLPRDKRVEVGLTYIYGVGRPAQQKALAATGELGHPGSATSVTRSSFSSMATWSSNLSRVTCRREVQSDIRRKVEIPSPYQGLRHRRGLPVHGQRTKTNARTRKGPKTVAGKKKAGK